jgi:type IV pilus biogenesis protein CpaD/CtpE
MKTLKGLVLISTIVAGGVLSACSNTQGASPSLPAVSLPAVSIDPSAASDAVLGVLDQLETEIAANESATGLTAEEGDALEGIVAKIKSAVETGDLSVAAPTVEELKAKVAELDAKLGTDAGARLKAALAQLESMLPG